jgi:hypothetical protein
MFDNDRGFKIVARHACPGLCSLAGTPCDQWQSVGDTLQTTERLADRAFRVRSGEERFVVYMEAYTSWKKSAPWSVLVKSALLSEREQLPTVSLVFIQRPRRYHPQKGEFRLSARGKPTQQVWFEEVCLWKVKPASWWEATPGLMALYPLCRHGRPWRGAVSYAAGVIQEQVTNPMARGDLLTTLGIFGKLAYPGLDVFQLIGREAMRESKFYQEIIEEGRLEGRLEEKRADIGEVLEARFGTEAAEEFRDVIGNVTELPRLSKLLRLASRCDRLVDFRRALRSTTATD